MTIRGKKIGLTFNNWTVIGEDATDSRLVTVRCACGTTAVRYFYGIQNGHSMSCGCLFAEKQATRIANLNRIHGETSGGNRSREYNVWRAMLARCTKPECEDFPMYGGRGITVCDEWLQFSNFLTDMGRAPHGMTLDRLDNNGPYSKANCCWRSPREQANNTRRNHLITFNGRTQTRAEWSRELGIRYGLIALRLRRGWTPERALTEPVVRP